MAARRPVAHYTAVCAFAVRLSHPAATPAMSSAASSSSSGSGAAASASGAARPSATKLAYKNVVKGKLSLKGGAARPVVSASTGQPVAKKRKKESAGSAEEQREWEQRELARLLANKNEQAERAAAAAAEGSIPLSDPAGEAAAKQAQIDELELDASLTKAERDFQRAQKQRELDLIKKKISKTHRQRVEVSSETGRRDQRNDRTACARSAMATR